MKGLLIKDWKLIKNQKTFIISMIVISIFFLSSDKNMQFGFTYLSTMIVLLTTNTIAYDDQNNGLVYLLTFPISRKYYVLEKYLFAAAALSASLCASTVILLLLSANGRVVLTPETFLTLLLSAILCAAIIMSVLIPVQLKFGSEKTRIALLIIFAGVFVICYGIMHLAKTFSIDMSIISGYLKQASPIVISVGIILLSLGMLTISCLISLAIIERKQF